MKTNFLILFLASCFLFGTTAEQKQLADDAMLKMMQKIYSETIKYKQALQAIDRDRDELLSNLASSAPRSPFIVNADLDASLLESNPEALIKLSTNNQQSWNSASAFPLNTAAPHSTPSSCPAFPSFRNEKRRLQRYENSPNVCFTSKSSEKDTERKKYNHPIMK